MYELDIDFWLSQFPLDPVPAGDWSGTRICGPSELAIIEQLRGRASRLCDLGPSVPVDVFVLAQGEPAQRDVTKIGGAPYRPAGLPWPETEEGTATFVAQFRFTESKDIIGSLPGDVLLVFARNDALYSDWPTDPPYFLYEWYDLGLTDLIAVEDIRPADWKIVNCHGYRHRTVDYIGQQSEHCLTRLLPNELSDRKDPESPNPVYALSTTCRYDALKIGGVPWWVDAAEEPYPLPGRFLCALPQIGPACGISYPWLNHADPIPFNDYFQLDTLSWYDCGCSVYFSIDDSDNIHMWVQLHANAQ